MKKLALAAAVALPLLCGLAVALRFALPPGPLVAQASFGGLMLDARGQILRMSLAEDDKYRLPVRLENIAPQAIAITLAYEDQHFYQHPGVNPVSLARGALSLLAGRRQGGSTITMQVARLRYKLKTTSMTGKLKQIWLALALELAYSKQDILEAYFNLAPYGGNVEGIEAASRVYFHKGAASLTEQECLALAIVPQNPVARKPDTGRAFNAARLRLAKTLQMSCAARLKVYSASDLPFRAPHLAAELLPQGGISQTAIEPDLQAMLERALGAYTSRNRRLGLVNGAALILRCSDMRLVALAGSANYHDVRISGQIDGTKARRSPGSTLKPFIYALALDQGLIHPLSILADAPRSFGGYDPENIDGDFRGPISATEALRASRNLPAISLANALALPGLYGFLQNAAVKLPQKADYYGLALTLGGAEVSMRELAGLYAMLANQGLWRPIRLLKTDSQQGARRLLAPEAAWLALKMLARPEATVNSRRGPVPVYYKTGTSNGLRDAWTAGIVGDYVLIVWLGNFNNHPNPCLVGAKAALPLFEEMAAALADLRQLEDDRALPPVGLNLVKTAICQSTGDIFRGQCENPVQSWIIPGKSPVRDSGILRKILVDNATGLRACEPGNAREVFWEFWPAEFRQIFAKAGVFKPEPPAWLPMCQKRQQPGQGPKILLPKKNVVYGKSASEPNFRLPLMAAAHSDKVHWYAGEKYLGSSKPDEILLFEAPAGKIELIAVDNNGNSTRQECKIVAKP